MSLHLGPYRGAKKLVVRNLRPDNQSRAIALEQYYSRVFRHTEDALDAILDGRDPSQPFDGLYKGVEDLCRSGRCEELYYALRRKMEIYLQSNVYPDLVPTALGPSTEDGTIKMLSASLQHWRRWVRRMSTICNVLSFLDRSYLLGHRDFLQLNDLAIFLFKRYLFGSKQDKNSPMSIVLAGMCLLVRYAREDSPAKDPQLLKDSVSMMKVLTLYTRQFEPIFLAESRSYFTKMAAECVEAYSLAQYVEFCNDYLVREEEKCLKFNFDSSTKKQLLEDANRAFIAERKEKLLDFNALSRLLAENQVATLGALFQLLKQSNLEKELKKPWEEFIVETGLSIVKDTSKADEMVMRLLLFRRNLDVVVRDAFEKSEDFTRGLREAFGHCVNNKRLESTWNTGTSRVGEMVAKHIDMLLRGGLKALPPALLSDVNDRQAAERMGHTSSGDSHDAELDRQLDNALELFRFIEGKDVFEAFYKKDLARRLLMNRSASQDAERNMLAKFRGECGSSFTQNLEQMFKDRELANEDMKAYKMYREGKGRKNEVDLQVSILSAAAWPTYPEVPCKLPLEIQKHIQDFDTYYLSKHTGRRLTWKHNLAQCVVKAKFSRGAKELLVSGFQAVILLLFNNFDEDQVLPFEYIAKETGIPSPDLNITLQSLACGKSRVLVKRPKSRDVLPTDQFVVNMGFWDQKFRIKINMIQMKETTQENKDTHERVAADRMFETQAAIVRIMKSRKQIGHNELVTEVINATRKRGAIDIAVIKTNIEKSVSIPVPQINCSCSVWFQRCCDG